MLQVLVSVGSILEHPREEASLETQLEALCRGKAVAGSKTGVCSHSRAPCPLQEHPGGWSWCAANRQVSMSSEETQSCLLETISFCAGDHMQQWGSGGGWAVCQDSKPSGEQTNPPTPRSCNTTVPTLHHTKRQPHSPP